MNNHIISLLYHDIYRRQPEESGFGGSGADRYKLSVTAFDHQLQSIRRVRRDAPILMTELPVAEGNILPPFTITVDDGGLSYYSIIADKLEAYGWRGHCLITTDKINQRGFLRRAHIRELHERGHVIGTHTHTHPSGLNRCRWDKQLLEWTISKGVLEDITGASVTVGSVPGGFYSKSVGRAAHQAGLDVLLTSEPETRVQNISGCLVAGRYTVRQNAGKHFSGKIAQHHSALMLKEWLAWNSKKLLKNAMGNGGFAQVSNWLAP